MKTVLFLASIVLSALQAPAMAVSSNPCPVGPEQGPRHWYCVATGKPASNSEEPMDKTKGPKLPRLAIAANAEGLTDTFVPKPNKPPKQTRGGGTRLIAEGVDIPTLPRCSQLPCLPGSTTLFSPNPEAPEQSTRGNLPRMFAQTIDRHVLPGCRGAPKGSAGGGTRMSVGHYFG